MWVAEKRNCGSDEYDDFRLFIHRNGSNELQDVKNGLRLESGDSVGYVWASDRRLLIAAAQSDDIADRREQIEGVALTYSVYSTTDPDRVQDPSAFIAVRRNVEARYRFETDNGAGMPGIGCTLYVEVDASPELNVVGLRIGADRVFQSAHGLEHIGSSILFYSNSDYVYPVEFVTAAALDNIEVEKDGRAVDSWERQRTPMPVPAGGLGPAWTIMWVLTEPMLQGALDELRAGQFEIRLGYWFDDKEYVYVNSRPGETKPIEDFARCVRSGAILPELR